MTERIGGCNYMKRYGHLYEKIYDMENLKLAHQHAKKGKGWYTEVQMIDSDPDKYLKRNTIQRDPKPQNFGSGVFLYLLIQ